MTLKRGAFNREDREITPYETGFQAGYNEGYHHAESVETNS